MGVCPVGILEPDKTGKATVADVSACTMCGVCADLCSAKAITVQRAKSSR